MGKIVLICIGGAIAALLIAAKIQDSAPAPTVDSIRTACAKEFAPNELLVNDCVIKTTLKTIATDQQDRLDRAQRNIR